MASLGGCVGSLLSLLCAFPLLVALVVRGLDAIYFDVALVRAGLREELMLVLLAVVLLAQAVGFLMKPLGTATVGVLMFAVTKHRADFSVPEPQISCGSGGGTCVALVTGGNSGIGFAISEVLARQGHTVLLACRSAGKCREAVESLKAHSGKVIPVPGLDLASLKSVHEWAGALPSLLEENGLPKVELFMANAGLVPGADNETTADGFEMGFGVNHLGHFALTAAMFESNLFAPDVSVVAVSSDAMRLGSFHSSLMNGAGDGDLKGEVTVGCGRADPICIPPASNAGMTLAPQPYMNGFNWGSYTRSKLANVLFARELAKRTGFSASSVHPGVVYTPMALAHSQQFAEVMNLETVLAMFLSVVLRPASSAANVCLHAAGREKGNHQTLKGTFFNGMGQGMEDAILPSFATDDKVAARLWEVSEAQVQRWKKSQ
eukprot:TRINITY_DN39699_c3_g2_i1.p1 TRINITY_DN39699_c3_g2~~TRINITY_DN39699_c3_g2_i1.p1  ORF type:complete len:464 (+),score=71.41 TRINITY_DN39699_c3_g2_i1:92-1393(+)